jgi:hypothetical protein
MTRIKKYLGLFICCFSLFYYGRPQAELLNSYGVEGGLADASISTAYMGAPDLKSRLGFTFGVQAQWLKSSFYSFITQLKYIQKGYSFDLEKTKINSDGTLQSAGTITISEQFDYLSLPVLFRTEYGPNRFVVYAQAGPRIDFFLQHSTDGEFPATDMDFKTVVVGGSAGAGINYLVHKTLVVGASIMYDFDFTKMDKSGNVKNNSLTVELNLTLIR